MDFWAKHMKYQKYWITEKFKNSVRIIDFWDLK